MDTIKVKRNGVPFIAHRGASALEPENTCAAFVAAGNRSYFGIETDVHLTADGRYVIIHNDTTGNMAGDDLCVEKSSFDTLRGLLLKQKDGKKGRSDLRMPTPQEYLSICSSYDKVAVMEIKNRMGRDAVHKLCDITEQQGWLDNTIYISFDLENLLFVREKLPKQRVQLLTGPFNDEILQLLIRYRIDLDVLYTSMDKEAVKKCHDNGIVVNTFTVDNHDDACRMIDMGVDYITTNALE